MLHKESIPRYIFKRFAGSFAAVFGILLGLIVIGGFIGMSLSKSAPSYEEMLIMNTKDAKSDLRVPFSQKSDLILQINIEGVIGVEKNPQATAKFIDHVFKQAEIYGYGNERYKGILLNVCSPGGAVYDSSAIYQMITQFKEKYNVPVHTWTHTLCASAAMYIASSSDCISSETINIIGSVGVKSPPYFNFYGWMKDKGIMATTLTAGKNKEQFPMFTPMPKDGQSHKDFDAIIETYYENFLSIVSKARGKYGLTRDKLRSLGATVYAPEKAKELGYIDRANVNYKEALAHLCKASNIEMENVQVVSFSKKESFFESLKSKFNAKIESLLGLNASEQFPITYEM